MQNLNVLKYYRIIYKECKQIKSYNFKDFFIRKLRYDFLNPVNKNKLSEEDLQLRLAETRRIRRLQNLYFELNDKGLSSQ